MKDDMVIDLAGQESRLLARTKYGSRLQMLERMAFRAPDSLQAWQQLTAALVEAGELDRAAITAAVLDTDTQDWRTLVLRSQAVSEADPAQALQLARRAVKLEPGQFRTHLQLARCHLTGGDPERDGLAASRQAVRLSQHHPETLEVQAQLLRLHGREEEADSVLGHGGASPVTTTRQSLAAQASIPRHRRASETVYILVLLALVLASAVNGIAVFAGAVNAYSGLPSALLLALAAIAMVFFKERR